MSNFAAADNSTKGVAAGASATGGTAMPPMKGGNDHKKESTMGGSKHSPMTGGNNKSQQSGGKRRKTRKMSTGAKSWVNFVKQVYKTNLAKNPSYKYKQAMKDAAKMKKKNKSMKM